MTVGNVERMREHRRRYRQRYPERVRGQINRWRLANPEKVRAKQRRFYYGVTQADYDKMLEAQGGVCAICGEGPEITRWGTFHLDHNHETNAVRGLLYDGCNLALGRLEKHLLAAYRYVEGGRFQRI